MDKVGKGEEGLTTRIAAIAACLGLLLVVGSATVSMAQNYLRAVPTARIETHRLQPLHARPPKVEFDAAKATNAYLAEVKGSARARSDAYFEGGYILLLVDALYAFGVSILLLQTRLSARMRDMARTFTPSRFWQAPLYVAQYVAVVAVLTFPLVVYESFLREHAYQLSNQNFVQWLGDFAKSFAVEILLATIALTIVYAIIRTAPRTWWLWSAIAVVGLVGALAFAFPVAIAPLFNRYEPLKAGSLKTEILSLARSEGVPAQNIYEFDASRQSKRISANVSGLFGTTRISLNDNLLKRCTSDEIVAVLGHEMGHYVLDHDAIHITWFGLLVLTGFAFVHWAFRMVVDRFGGAWDVHALDDPAGLPVLMALFSAFMLIATPIANTMTRTLEAQADIFGLNAVRKPDAFAKVALMMSEYRKLDPTPLEEFVFYDHPSGRSRIAMAMRWKAEHLNDLDIKSGPVSPQ